MLTLSLKLAFKISASIKRHFEGKYFVAAVVLHGFVPLGYSDLQCLILDGSFQGQICLPLF